MHMQVMQQSLSHSIRKHTYFRHTSTVLNGTLFDSLNSFASNMVKLSVNETKWSSLPARTRALILYISILMFDFGPEKRAPGIYLPRKMEVEPDLS